jgi:integrase
MSANSELWEHIETNLIKYRPNGMYYVKAKIHGKKVKESLDTVKLTEARKKLAAWLNRVRGGSTRGKSASTMRALVEEWKAWLKNKVQAPRTTECRLDNWRVIEDTWPNLNTTKISNITRHDVETWRDGLITKHQYSTAQANQCLGTLKQIFRLAEDKGMLLHDSPALRVKQLRQTMKKLKLPSKEELKALRAVIYSRSPEGGELFDFLSMSGARIDSSQHVTWGDVDWTANKLTFNKAKRGAYTIPLFAPLKEFLLKIRPDGWKPSDRITKVDSIKKVLGNSCKFLKMGHLSHHDLRHWHATQCIEAGVDIPTLSRWLGHKDGGALALRVYGHLRDEHSQQMAALLK